ncbi:hypothetical protein RUM43_000332 [Polyplax serrata]|uniref:Uncharacterized protein n=1 Tax=Polyplax serrata TaxID=468196 RepID=A0AAN8XS41_POLSC
MDKTPGKAHEEGTKKSTCKLLDRFLSEQAKNRLKEASNSPKQKTKSPRVGFPEFNIVKRIEIQNFIRLSDGEMKNREIGPDVDFQIFFTEIYVKKDGIEKDKNAKGRPTR